MDKVPLAIALVLAFIFAIEAVPTDKDKQCFVDCCREKVAAGLGVRSGAVMDFSGGG